ncbi:prepilin-type N-terminal cleavage/methylation domain-containing protein [Planctomycetota bacterium]
MVLGELDMREPARRQELHPKREKGFTLVELIVVIVIIATIMAFVIPAIDRITPKHSLRAAARDIAGTIDLVRGTAAGKGRVMAVYYDLDAGTYTIYGPPPEGELGERPWGLAPVGTRRKLPRFVHFVGIQPEGLRYQTSGELKVRFDPLAIEGSHIIHLENTKEQTYSVKYNAFLGQAVTLRGEAEFEDGS